MPTPKLSPTMRAVLERLARGDGRIVPKQGGYWLPGDIAEAYRDESGNAWFCKAQEEFGAHVGTRTVDALAARGYLVRGERGFDTRTGSFFLRIHHLAPKATDTPSPA